MKRENRKINEMNIHSNMMIWCSRNININVL